MHLWGTFMLARSDFTILDWMGCQIHLVSIQPGHSGYLASSSAARRIRPAQVLHKIFPQALHSLISSGIWVQTMQPKSSKKWDESSAAAEMDFITESSPDMPLPPPEPFVIELLLDSFNAASTSKYGWSHSGSNYLVSKSCRWLSEITRFILSFPVRNGQSSLFIFLLN